MPRFRKLKQGPVAILDRSVVRYDPNDKMLTRAGKTAASLIHPNDVMLNMSVHVRFGSKADICTAPAAHVRFTPNSGHLQSKTTCPLRAKTGRSSWQLA